MLKQNGNSAKAKIIRIFLIFCIALLAFSLFADNNMELIWEQQGEFNQSEYGYSIASIDFNGDNIDDLVVGSDRWNPQGQPNTTAEGKIYFYWGGTNFDNISDLTMDGSQYGFSTSLGRNLVNLGDINGDGYEDLGSRRLGNYPISGIRHFIEIYYGGLDCDTIPDFEHLIYFDDVESMTPLYPLGDVNGDGYDDAGYVIITRDTDVNQYYIIFGGETLEVEYWNTVGSGGMSIRGIGNINNDEYDDFLICFKDTENQLKHNVIIYGNTVIDTVLTDTLYSNIANFRPGGAYAGDFNGDGADDFIGCWGAGEGTELWFGNDILSEVSDVHLNAYSDGGKGFDFGDLNNDGYSDIILGNPIWSNHRGKAYFFIGDENANGSIDLDIPCPAVVSTEFGTSVAVGDFNNDGFDDAAIGAPEDGYPIHEGKVYIYAGNNSLEETTPVSIYEEEIHVVDGIEFHAYPNPFNPIINFEIIAEGYDNLQIEIYNIKGQMVKTLSFESAQDDRIVWNAEDQPSSVYLCKLINFETKVQLAVQKITLLK